MESILAILVGPGAVLVPVILWVLTFKKCFKQRILTSIGATIFIVFTMVAAFDAVIPMSEQYEGILKYFPTLTVYILYLMVPIILLIIQKRKA